MKPSRASAFAAKASGICSVARTRLVSKCEDEETAWLTVNGHAEDVDLVPAARPVGSTIRFGTSSTRQRGAVLPGRTEQTRIEDVLRRLALVAWTSRSSSAVMAASPSATTSRMIFWVRSIGRRRAVRRALARIDVGIDGIQLGGWVASPTFSRPAGHAVLFVNGRTVACGAPDLPMCSTTAIPRSFCSSTSNPSASTSTFIDRGALSRSARGA